jgi:nucleotide-binding universal stress UspA family protein
MRHAGVDVGTIASCRQQARSRALQQLQALAVQAGLRLGEWEPTVADGDAALRLVESERERGCDLLVLGKHGQSATEELLLGSVTKHVLAEGRSDVLISTRQQPTPA